jgi:NitT/TauT family transport system permease protein
MTPEREHIGRLPDLREVLHLTRMTLARVVPRRLSWGDAAVVLFLGLFLYGLVRLGREWEAPAGAAVTIDLSLKSLPIYTFFSLCRGLAAFGLSFVFTLVYGYIAARVRLADKVMLPLLDVLQSIPVLGFMPGLVLALAALFPRTNMGLELAAILMIFTGQVWNMTFSFYHSLRSIPPDLLDAGRVYRFGWWRRFTRIELPSATVGLVWNGMMSMAGGWFFLTINEAFRLGPHDFRLPGVGAYMSAAIDQNNHPAMLAAVLAMIVMIVLLDQFFWRPLVAWSGRFKFEDVGATISAGSWVLDLLRRTRLYVWTRVLSGKLRTWWQRRRHAATPRDAGRIMAPVLRRAHGTIAFATIIAPLMLVAIWGTLKLGALLSHLDLAAWGQIVRASLFTFARVTAAVVLGTLWAVPVGVYIGTSPRASRVLQPVVQVAASFPAPMLFPLVLLLMSGLSIPLGIGAIALLMLGTQWYILFNVIAGATSIPYEFHEAARIYSFNRRQRWRRLLLPGIFPHLVTGWVTASGGAWNASIVAEYIHAGGAVRTADGLGALISTAAEGGHFPLLAGGILTMACLVVVVNRVFWKRLYALAESRYALSR